MSDIVQRLNAAIAEAFKDDPANAVRAHAAVLPLLVEQTAQSEDARDAARYRAFVAALVADYNGEELSSTDMAIKKTLDIRPGKLSVDEVTAKIDAAMQQENGK